MDSNVTPNTIVPESWAALSGRWSFTQGIARYLGPAEQLSCLSRGPCMLYTRYLLRLPGGVVFHDGVQNRQ
jgi:hypothetical protein